MPSLAKLVDTRNHQFLSQHRNVVGEVIRGSAIRPAGDRVAVMYDLCGYSLDAPEMIPTGGHSVSRLSDGRLVDCGHGMVSPAMSYRFCG